MKPMSETWDKRSVREVALIDVLKERERQDEKWGEQNLDPITYLVVLTEEVGELSEAALHTRFGGDAAEGLRTEATHVAAVGLAIVECIDRGLWKWAHTERDELRAALADLLSALDGVLCTHTQHLQRAEYVARALLERKVE